MSKKGKILIISLSVISLIFVEVLRLHYTIEAVRLNKKINIEKLHVKSLKKEISKEKIKLMEKSNLNNMKIKAEKELDMEVSKTIKYVKIKKSVSKQN
jgi:hypothetical protein